MFHGSYVALITPFKEGRLDELALRKLVKFHISEGTDGIVPCGTTGESATLSHDEHNRVIEIVIEEASGKIKVMAGSGSNSTLETCSLSRGAEKAGADGLLLITPYYNRPSQLGLYEHYKTVADSVDIPMVLYSVPSRTGVEIDVDTVCKLSEIDNIAGIKEASGNMNRVSCMIAHVSKGFEVISGDDSTNYPLLSLGGSGIISVVANVVPRKCKDMVEAALNGDFKIAQKLHYELLDISFKLFVQTNPIPVKYACAQMGLCGLEIRQPLNILEGKYEQEVKDSLKNVGAL